MPIRLTLVLMAAMLAAAAFAGTVIICGAGG